jgi:hypothetical protein
MREDDLGEDSLARISENIGIDPIVAKYTKGYYKTTKNLTPTRQMTQNSLNPLASENILNTTPNERIKHIYRNSRLPSSNLERKPTDYKYHRSTKKDPISD